MSIFDHPDSVSVVPTWRCPHCRTLQPEASLCRACERAAVTCSTCHLYRASFVTDVGYCANDRTRALVMGDEARSCWEATPAPAAAPGLFDDLDTAPARPPGHTGNAAEAPASTPATLTREVPGAAWLEIDPPGRLVDAPHVAPGRELMSEVQRRSRRSRGD